jgi:hypothetical protein
VTEYRRLSDAFKGPRVKLGQVAWQAARLAQAQLQLADGELIALESDGSLALTRDTSQGFDVRSQVARLKQIAWTPMTPSVRSSACMTTHRSSRSISRGRVSK